ncbi:hypothetical protein MNEG_4689 [Monoraphidium neglectum]|uniref:Inhibitor I9 domain-containing protein n=1 Tax=Monoraphidium neglectum TaxID=145388 RepID=A0A0D2ND69_9CHLO|nr:hypothetical protein MNEG_4689 [Monoraphidium neglectum]KIZ03271.1 hypothetical protein MNEG_4689 [Monoraphidium neglectum]|eukprot:XP_013902290.1 hypothetical protein MNEG_4689 [Monoraphidium neglectum]
MASAAQASLIIPQPNGRSPLVILSTGPPKPYPRGSPAAAASGPPGKPRPYPAAAPASQDPAEAAAAAALAAGQPQDMLVVFQRDDKAGNAAVKARVFAPTSAASKAGNRLARDYSSLAISLVTVPNLAALKALKADPNVQSVQPDRQAHTMQPGSARAGGPGPARVGTGGPAPAGAAPAGPAAPVAGATKGGAGSFVLGRD